MVAGQITTELTLEHCCALLRMLSIPLAGPALSLGDDMSVLLNTTVPSSSSKKSGMQLHTGEDKRKQWLIAAQVHLHLGSQSVHPVSHNVSTDH